MSVDISVVTYHQHRMLPIIMNCFIIQTHPDWRMLVVHDGPDEQSREIVESINDPRIEYREMEERQNDYGHTLRSQTLDHWVQSKYVLFTNADNYYLPSFLETMFHTLEGGCDVAYCDMIHRGKVKLAAMKRAHVDCGSAVVRTKIAKIFGWRGRQHWADWQYFADMLEAGATHKRIPYPLFIHN